MKIAVITWFNNLNFGTALQAWALQEYLKENFNAQVELIAYHSSPENILQIADKKKEHFAYKLLQKAKSAIHDEYKAYDKKMATVYKNEKNLKKQNFKDFYKNIVFTKDVYTQQELVELSNEYDVFICGSDQIWNPQILDKNYYLNFVKGKTKIAYASSFGINYLPDYAKPYIKDYLSDFKAIGIRESTCQQQLQELTKQNIEVVCDPTLLINKNQWQSLGKNVVNDNEKYFVTYFLGDTPFSRKAIDIAQKELGIKNIILPSNEYTLGLAPKENIAYGPAEFISLIENAQFVLTDSFHATCFSLIFEKNFCVLQKHSSNNPFRQNSRIESLLKIVDLSDKLVTNKTNLIAQLHSNTEYSKANEKLSKYIASSYEFLENNLR